MITVAQTLDERIPGLLRVHIQYSHAKAIMVTWDRTKGKTDTIREYSDNWDVNNARRWGPPDFPYPYDRDRSYYNCFIHDRTARFIVASSMGDTMVIDFNNDSTLADHNLAFEFRKGHYYFDLPSMKKHFVEGQSKEFLKRQFPSAWFLGSKGREFLWLNDIRGAEVQMMGSIPVFLNTRPFTIQPKSCLLFGRVKDGMISYDPWSIQEFITTEDEWCYLNYLIEPVEIIPVSEDPHQPCFGSLNSKGIPRVHPDQFKGCDTSFMELEIWVNEALIQNKPVRCNTNHLVYSHVEFPVISDSLVSLVIYRENLPLLPKDKLEMDRYRIELENRGSQNKELQKRIEGGKKSKRKRFQKVDFPDLSFVDPTKRVYWDLEEVWQPVDSCTQIAGIPIQNDSIPSMTMFPGVFNPYTMRPYSIEELFGPEIRAYIYKEMLEVERAYPERHFNIHQYKPENQRSFLWGLSKDGLMIYYGNEGEFGGYYRHEIPLKNL
mgnify:FL=1